MPTFGRVQRAALGGFRSYFSGGDGSTEGLYVTAAPVGGHWRGNNAATIVFTAPHRGPTAPDVKEKKSPETYCAVSATLFSWYESSDKERNFCMGDR